jgi:hypothetical protein
VQLPWPEAQLEVHTPPVHAGVATLDAEHARAQAPQLAVEVARLVSQPSSAAGAAGCVQLPALPLQVEVHKPPAQLAVATPADEQARAQAPQLAVEVARLVSQPSSAAGAAGCVQLPKPPVQVELHTPPVQLVVAACSPEQARPQAPQLAAAGIRVSLRDWLLRPPAPHE